MPAMPPMPTGTTLLLACCAAFVALVLAVFAAVLLARGAEDRDVGLRLRSMVQPVERSAGRRTPQRISTKLLRPFRRLGEILHDSAIISTKEMAVVQRGMTAAGFNGGRAVPVFLGIKAVLLLALPLAAVALGFVLGLDAIQAGSSVAAALVLAVLAPNRLLGHFRKAFQNRLRRGLPDALDLMVVAAEAGLGLETAVERVARELAGANAAIAMELNTLLQEMRMLPDRRLALDRMADRTDLECFKRLAATLSQTLRFGTPLAQALRVLASDMRQERMLRIEEKAIRLPALLIGPLILFILPALFIALIGPSVLELGQTFGAPQ